MSTHLSDKSLGNTYLHTNGNNKSVSLQALGWQYNSLEVCLDKYITEYNHHASCQDSLTDYIYSVPVSITNIGSVSWHCISIIIAHLSNIFDMNGCYKRD